MEVKDGGRIGSLRVRRILERLIILCSLLKLINMKRKVLIFLKFFKLFVDKVE